LEAEVERLKRPEPAVAAPWVTGGIGLVTGAAGAFVTLLVARLTRLGVLDQAVHAKRLEFYTQLAKATEPLAIFFPTDQPSLKIDPGHCAQIGRALSSWYFSGAGLLLSREARDAYFRLARGLTLASVSDALSVPTFPSDAKSISVERLKRYRDELGTRHGMVLTDLDRWTFREPDPGSEDCVRFKDYVLLQKLTSDLRTMLSEDLRGRRRPR
jgi:hypothetical protein